GGGLPEAGGQGRGVAGAVVPAVERSAPHRGEPADRLPRRRLAGGVEPEREPRRHRQAGVGPRLQRGRLVGAAGVPGAGGQGGNDGSGKGEGDATTTAVHEYHSGLKATTLPISAPEGRHSIAQGESPGIRER